ncbi:hypothetical protein EDB83DRAFT_1326156 [Lactarius deliciosus]|nr:hypothetical protein EDB83DRAFT_1326156 [Lactarius deliciosus]
MATLIRSTKSGSDWKSHELLAYNITVTSQDVATFFGNPTLPPSSLHRVILENEIYPPGGIADRDDRKFFFYLELAMRNPPTEGTVEEFAAHLLGLLGYDDIVAGGRILGRICRQKHIPLFMCGGYTHAKSNVCVANQNAKIFLLVQEQEEKEGVDPEAQLIAQAIAAFQYNNRLLLRIGKEPIRAKTIPGIITLGSTPTFYKIRVTQDLVDAIETAQYPENPTTVHRLVPPVDDLDGLARDGMQPLNNRAVILGLFEAFKQFVD